MSAVEALLLLSSVLGASEFVLLDFTADWCGPCRMMESTVARLDAEGIPVRKINIDHQPELVSQYQVTAVPCFVLLVNGHEVNREVGATSYEQLKQMVVQAKPRKKSPQPDLRAGHTSGTHSSDFSVSLQNDGNVSPPPSVSDLPTSATSHSVPISSDHKEHLLARAMAATVRLKISELNGSSCGSGTIIDVHGEDALVLTCGHIFRETSGRGKITVDLFSENGPHSIAGQLVRYDLERDLALVSIRPGVPVQTMRVAPRDYQPIPGQRVLVTGCDHGGEPIWEETKIASINRFLGPPNLQVVGQPVDGRSGGGLFTEDGLVVGVCNAADPLDRQGLYSALEAVQFELDQAGLTSIYKKQNQPGDVGVATSPLFATGSQAATSSQTSQVQPLTNRTQNTFVEQPKPENQLISDTFSKMIPHTEEFGQAELICIVRSPQQSAGKSQVFVINDASPELVRQFAKEMQTKTTLLSTNASPASGAGKSPSKNLASPAPVMRAQSPNGLFQAFQHVRRADPAALPD